MGRSVPVATLDSVHSTFIELQLRLRVRLSVSVRVRVRIRKLCIVTTALGLESRSENLLIRAGVQGSSDDSVWYAGGVYAMQVGLLIRAGVQGSLDFGLQALHVTLQARNPLVL